MRLPAACLLISACSIASASPVRADATAFVGLTTPTARFTGGVAGGGGLPMIPFELEYARSARDMAEGAPAISTIMFNLLVQTVVPIHSTYFYGTGGVGIYGESFGDGRGETDVGTNVGGGVKIALAGPLRLRLDYRLFLLRGSPLDSKPQRVYAGLNIAF